MIELARDRAAVASPPRDEAPAAAVWPRDRRADARLLLVHGDSGVIEDGRFRDLTAELLPGDLVVVNDAATLPASLEAVTEQGERLELRLAAFDGEGFIAIALGAGSFRDPTERRGPPPLLWPGARLLVTRALGATVRSVHARELGVPRRLSIDFDRTGDELWSELYRAGRPIQYSYVARELSLFHVQNVFAGRPWAFELASAGFSFDWEALLALRLKGVELASLTHAAGISSTGSAALDRELPLPERYDLPFATVAAVRRARRNGRRVIAVGTSVVRALESAASRGSLAPGPGEARLVLDEHYHPRVVDAVLSGIHPPGGSHFELLASFAPRELLARASREAARLGYLQHEFGDLCLVFSRGPERPLERSA